MLLLERRLSWTESNATLKCQTLWIVIFIYTRASDDRALGSAYERIRNPHHHRHHHQHHHHMSLRIFLQCAKPVRSALAALCSRLARDGAGFFFSAVCLCCVAGRLVLGLPVRRLSTHTKRKRVHIYIRRGQSNIRIYRMMCTHADAHLMCLETCDMKSRAHTSSASSSSSASSTSAAVASSHILM